VAFKEYDVSRDSAAAEEMVNLTGQMGVPVIVIDGQVVVGFNPVRVRELVSIGGTTTQPVRFGLKIADALSAAPQMGVNPVAGAIIGEVSPVLLGDKAGLKTGDIVTEINGNRIGNAADMEKTLAGLKSGDIVTILFLRSGENRKSEIII
jgi:S1-C subfamily serine protease